MISIFHAHIHSLWMRGVPTTTIESATIRTTKGNWHCWKSFLNEYIHCRGFLLYCSHKTCYPSKDLLKSISLVSLKLGLLCSPFLIILAFPGKKGPLPCDQPSYNFSFFTTNRFNHLLFFSLVATFNTKLMQNYNVLWVNKYTFTLYSESTGLFWKIICSISF